MANFVMPKLGADMTAGTLVAWTKQPGDAVRRGDVVAEVETDKGVIEVEIFTSGVIDKVLVQPGAKVPVGTVLATIREEEAPAGAAPPFPSPPWGEGKGEGAAPAVPPAPAAAAPTAPFPPAPVAEPGRLRISPSARELARKLGVDPATVQGTGRGGVITREDIERAAAAPAAPVPPPAADRSTRMRQTIAAAMSRSKREIPHYYLSTTIDLHRALTWLAQENQKRPVTERLLYGVLLLKAVALALREVPELNGLWDGDRAVPSAAIHVGVAIALRQGGLVAPALHHADRQSLGELMSQLRDLVNRARAGSLRSSELSDPTITVTSLGEQGVEMVFPIIYPPQVAIVGFGKVVQRPWVVDGQVVARPVVTATLSADHRVSDGHRGGLFLAAVDRLLQEPSTL
jgi:pyruvate dehydrogenase E2 component (dihydrolipoamide acetyltransferase)